MEKVTKLKCKVVEKCVEPGLKPLPAESLHALETEGDLTQITGDYRKDIACGEWSVSRAHFELPDQTKEGGDTFK